MWIVIKIKKNSFDFFSKNLSNAMGSKLKLYYPIYCIDKKKNKHVTKKFYNLLGNYIFCYHPNFKDFNFVEKIKYIKGIDQILNSFKNDQFNIENFINFCKKNETKEGILNSNFFKNLISLRGKFLNGPFVNMIFDIVKKDKNILNLVIGNLKIKACLKNNLVFYPN